MAWLAEFPCAGLAELRTRRAPLWQKIQIMEKTTSIGKYVIAGIFFIYLVLSLFSFWIADEQRLIDIFEDDAYYYFTIADNVSEGHGLTFDGQTTTNGFQPLWLLTLLPIYLIWKDPVLCLRIVGTVSILLTGCTGLLGIRYLFKYPLPVFFISSVFFVVSLVSISNTGMETAILLPLLIATLILLDKRASEDAQVILAAGFLALALLARLDVIFLAIALVLLSFAESRHRLFLAILPGVLLGSYLIANLWMTGHIIPTSGAAKSLNTNGQFINLRFFHQLTTPNNPVDGNVWIIFGMVFLLSVGLVGFYLLRAMRSRSMDGLMQGRVPLAVAGFVILFTLYYLLRTTWVLWRWYSYPIALFSIFVLPFLLSAALAKFEPYPSYARTLRIGLTAVSLILIVNLSVIALRQGYWASTSQQSFKYSNYLAAKQINDRMSAPSVLGMGDRAGSFAYFFEGDVLQLEGLLGDYELIQAIGTDRLPEYMDDFGVDYVGAITQPPTDYDMWEILSPLPMLTNGPSATIVLCRESEYLSVDSPEGGIYIWRWPSCGG